VDDSGTVTRRFGPGDWRALRDLRLQALRDSPSAFLGSHAAEAARTPEQWRALASTRAWFAAEQGAEHVGLASVVRDPDSAEHYLESMWVRPDRRGQGVVAALLAAAEGVVVADGHDRLLLWVLDGNARAALAYERHGFAMTANRQTVPGHPGLKEQEYCLDVAARRRRLLHDARHGDADAARHGGVLEGAQDLDVDPLRDLVDHLDRQQTLQ
jgi:GNAT superfamily N-acetyltransferase